MKLKNLLSLILLLAVVYSCGVSKKQKAVLPHQNAEIEIPKAETIPYNTLSAQYKGSFNSIPFKLQFRISHDSLIWVSVSTLLGEAARAQLTEDSVYFMDRINSDAYIISKNRVEEAGNQTLDNAELEKFLTDSTKTDFSFAITEPFEASVDMKKSFNTANEPVIDVMARVRRQDLRLKLIQTALEYDKPLQYPFTIPKKFTIKRL